MCMLGPQYGKFSDWSKTGSDRWCVGFLARVQHAISLGHLEVLFMSALAIAIAMIRGEK